MWVTFVINCKRLGPRKELTIVHRRHCPRHGAGPQGSVELREVGLVDTGDVAVVRHPDSTPGQLS